MVWCVGIDRKYQISYLPEYAYIKWTTQHSLYVILRCSCSVSVYSSGGGGGGGGGAAANG